MDAQPNVICIVLDTGRADRVSALGYERETTPAFDEFAADATLFTDAVSQASWSVPSHASLFTGQYPREHGATITSPVLTADTLLPDLLASGGYETYGISPNEYIRPATGFADGFDEFRMTSGGTEPGVAADILAPGVNWVTSTPALRRPIERLFNTAQRSRAVTTKPESPPDDQLLEHVSAVLDRADDPFFLFLNLLDTHLPRSPDEKYIDQFVDRGLDTVPIPQTERGYTVSEYQMDAQTRRRLSQLYDADLRTLDDRLGRLLELFQRRDLLADSVVVLVSDHGEQLGEFGLVGHQFSVFDSVVSVPLAVQFPDGGPDRIDDQVEIRRLFETILDETGLGSYPDRSLRSGVGDEVARGAFFSPMVDIEQLVWNDTVAFDPELLGEPLSFARTGEKKLIQFDGDEWLFELPEGENHSLSTQAQTQFTHSSHPLDRRLEQTDL